MKLLFSAVFLVFALSGADGQAAGVACGGTNSDTCDANLVCDTTDTKCKLDFGGDCSGGNSGNCKTGSICDSTGNLCKLDVGGDCSSANSGNCKTGTTCETTTNLCKFPIGTNCATVGTTECLTNAECFAASSPCMCKNGYQMNSDRSACVACSGASIAASMLLLLLSVLASRLK